MFYGAMVWDPWLIVSQIVCLQCLYYLALGLFMALLVGTRVPRLTLLYFFDFATLTPRTPTGWCAIASFLLAAVAGYAAAPHPLARSEIGMGSSGKTQNAMYTRRARVRFGGLIASGCESYGCSLKAMWRVCFQICAFRAGIATQKC